MEARKFWRGVRRSGKAKYPVTVARPARASRRHWPSIRLAAMSENATFDAIFAELCHQHAVSGVTDLAIARLLAL